MPQLMAGDGLGLDLCIEHARLESQPQECKDLAQRLLRPCHERLEVEAPEGFGVATFPHLPELRVLPPEEASPSKPALEYPIYREYDIASVAQQPDDLRSWIPVEDRRNIPHVLGCFLANAKLALLDAVDLQD